MRVGTLLELACPAASVEGVSFNPTVRSELQAEIRMATPVRQARLGKERLFFRGMSAGKGN
jgi:hypothetical protein